MENEAIVLPEVYALKSASCIRATTASQCRRYRCRDAMSALVWLATGGRFAKRAVFNLIVRIKKEKERDTQQYALERT